MRTLRFISVLLSLCLLLAGCGLFSSYEDGAGQGGMQLRPGAQQATQPRDEASTVPVIVTPEPTEPAPTRPEVSVLNDQNRERINVFLSNFAEQRFDRYPADDTALLHFGYVFAKINKTSVLKLDGSVYYIKKADMDVILYDYFGIGLAAPGEGQVYFYDDGSVCATYTGGRYEFPAADGANYDYVAIATDMVDCGDGTYRVEFDLFSVPYGIDRNYYKMSAAELDATGWVTYQQSGHALVRDHVRTSGKQSYLLLEYEID